MNGTKSYRILSILLLSGGLVLSGGCGEDMPGGTANPYYQHGLSLRQDNQMDEAIAAFHKCLRVSPGVDEAHFQLGILYQDHREDPVRALYHYTIFIERRQNDHEDVEVARQSAERIRRQLFEQWSFAYPEVIRAHANIGELERQVAVLEQARDNQTEQIRRLLEIIRQKNQEISRLQQ